MTLQQLKYVAAVADNLSISEAAKKVYISQPSLTAAIRELENEMNIQIFSRSNKGVSVTNEGQTFLSYARQVLEQADLLEEKFTGKRTIAPKFSVSCQHYSFAVNAFVDVIKEFDAEKYNFTLRETQTHEIIEDVTELKSEIGVIYTSTKNEDIIMKLIKKNDLCFSELFTAEPHVFICDKNPLASKAKITLEDLEEYPYLTFEQGDYNSFYYSEEPLPLIDQKKSICVRDRATLFNLLIGLNGYTVSSGVISRELNGESIVARPLDLNEKMKIGILTRRNIILSPYGKAYIEAIKRHI